MYLQSEEIVNRFKFSWIATLEYYSDLIDNNSGFEGMIPLFLFIQKLKQAGDDGFFRLERSRQDLIFSRSTEPALRADQQFIKIRVMDNLYEITFRDGNKMHKQYQIKDLEDTRLADLLQTLKDILVD